jgi:uncharacterized protein YndB with AHSA1/START domain
MQSTVTARVSAPVPTVWAVLSDHEGMASWGPGIRVRLDREGARERNGVGAVRRISTPAPLPAIVEEITAFEPGERLGYRAVSGVPLKEYAGEVRLAPHGSGTEITYSVSAFGKVPVLDRVATQVIATALLNALVRAVRKAERSGTAGGAGEPA